MVGYRYYETEEKEVRFCFGHGLSYTSFDYENLEVEPDGSGWRVKVDVTNTGACAGAETVQVYVKADGMKVRRPVKELRGFQKVALQPGEKQTVEICLDRKKFSYYEEERAAFWVPEDRYEICVGSSVKDIRLSKEIQVPAGTV